MENKLEIDWRALRLSAWLLLAGQILYVIVTLFHAGGDANNHPVIFERYAASGTWTAVHLAQFACTAMMLAGLLTLFFGLDAQDLTGKWSARFGAVLTVVSFALYGVVLAVDGVALKQAVIAWVNAPETEKAARFATAEAVRWLEWGTRSYEAFAVGLALVLFAITMARTTVPKPIAYLMAASGLAYWVQGWTAGVDGFSSAHVVGIEAAEVLTIMWAAWLLAFVYRKR